jgi:hypothetical protein
MAIQRKLTMQQLMNAVDVMNRFLDEYQTLDMQNSDAIVEYEYKVARIAVPLNIKKWDRACSYSLADLLQSKGNVRIIDPSDDILIGCDFL